MAWSASGAGMAILPLASEAFQAPRCDEAAVPVTVTARVVTNRMFVSFTTQTTKS